MIPGRSVSARISRTGDPSTEAARAANAGGGAEEGKVEAAAAAVAGTAAGTGSSFRRRVRAS